MESSKLDPLSHWACVLLSSCPKVGGALCDLRTILRSTWPALRHQILRQATAGSG